MVSVSGRGPIRCEGLHTKLNIPSPLANLAGYSYVT